MSVLHINNITNKEGTGGPTIAGITTVDSTGFMKVPVGSTGRRTVSDFVPNSIIDDGLVLYLDAGNIQSYPGSGTTWTDLSGNGNNGTLVNGVGFSAENGGSLEFDGSSGYIELNTFSSRLTGSMTFSSWVKSAYTNPTTRGEVLFSAHNNTNNRLRWQIHSTFIFISDITDVADTKFTHSALTPNTWHYYALRINASSNTITLFLDGKVIATDVFVGWGTGINRVSIGQEWDSSPSEHLNGLLSNFQAYNRTLSNQEILQNYNALKGRYI